ncbi:hypothetical protein Rcae01_05932 [Novipirellula caenicola]|uniref:Uncharacterized protein n=1 Tax=Novipirellula caenicola TaxID=1536901 RepID=A0ABP9VZ80_9BACT
MEGICIAFFAGCAFIGLGLFRPGLLLLAEYCIIWIEFVPTGAAREFSEVGDYSYRMYIFAYPIQQSVVNNVESISPIQMLLVSPCLDHPIAAISWHFLEWPVLKRSRFRREKEPKLAN